MPTKSPPARSPIRAFFEKSPRKVFRYKDLTAIFHDNRVGWDLPSAISFSEFLKLLLQEFPLSEIKLSLAYRPETVYVWGKASPYAVALAAKPGSYLCHYTAMALHELTQQIPRTIYVNVEQRPQKQPPGGLSQERIDLAMRRPQRTTSNVVKFGGFQIAYVNGKYTNRLGVITLSRDKEELSTTGLERTLVDIAVRPAYAGGVGEVASAYALAQERLSVNRLAAILRQLDYTYPYDQVVGYYLERAGYPAGAVNLFRERPFKFDFYLTYGMENTDYSERWRLYVPKGFNPLTSDATKLK